MYRPVGPQLFNPAFLPSKQSGGVPQWQPQKIRAPVQCVSCFLGGASELQPKAKGDGRAWCPYFTFSQSTSVSSKSRIILSVSLRPFTQGDWGNESAFCSSPRIVTFLELPLQISDPWSPEMQPSRPSDQGLGTPLCWDDGNGTGWGTPTKPAG